MEGCDISLGSLRNTPCESLEHETGVRVLRYAVIPDSGGAGRFRGGSALRLDVRVLHPDTIFTARGMERTKFQPWGLDGGQAGAASDCWLDPETAEAHRLGKVDVERLAAGTVISLRTPGGGGYGDPLTRDPIRVLDDVLDGFVSIGAARAQYGVAIAGATVDLEATQELRRNGMARGIAARFNLGTGRQRFMNQFSPALLDELAGLLASLPLTLRYRAKQLAFARMSQAATAVDAGWLRQHWSEIQDALLGRRRAA